MFTCRSYSTHLPSHHLLGPHVRSPAVRSQLKVFSWILAVFNHVVVLQCCNKLFCAFEDADPQQQSNMFAGRTGSSAVKQ